MNITDKLDMYLTEARAPIGGFKDEEEWNKWLKFQEKRAIDKAAFRARMDDKKFMNKLKIFLGMRTATLK